MNRPHFFTHYSFHGLFIGKVTEEWMALQCVFYRRLTKEKMAKNIFMAQPSLFFPHFNFTLMNVYMNTGIK